jgi:hypothetical protein
MTINLPFWQIYSDKIAKLKMITLIKIEVTGKQGNLKNKINH